MMEHFETKYSAFFLTVKLLLKTILKDKQANVLLSVGAVIIAAHCLSFIISYDTLSLANFHKNLKNLIFY